MCYLIAKERDAQGWKVFIGRIFMSCLGIVFESLSLTL